MAEHIRKGSIKGTVTKVVLTQTSSFSPASVEQEVLRVLRKALGKEPNQKQTIEVKLVCHNTINVLKKSNMVRTLPDKTYELNTRIPAFR